MDKRPYTILATTPRLGKAGETVSMTPRAARYWVRAGVLVADPAAPAATDPGTPDADAAAKPAAKPRARGAANRVRGR